MQTCGIYIHIPFCVSKCHYCDFYSHTSTQRYMDEYLCSVKKELTKYRRCSSEYSVDTIYFGGGTPSLFGAGRILSVIDAITDIFCHDLKEISVECNPESTDKNFLREIFLGGVNRISVGMQTAVNSELKSLGRRHSAEDVSRVINELVSVGFQNYSLDLMLGIPDQSVQSLSETIGFVKNLRPTHISAYLLKIEPGTHFHNIENSLNLPNEDLCCDLYEYAHDRFENMGFSRYEISNFSKDDSPCLHNLTYWKCLPYLGIGPGAHSFFDGKRFYYPADTDSFINMADDTAFHTISDGNGGDIEEKLMLGLRLSEGISLDVVKSTDSELYSRLLKNAVKLEKIGMMKVSGDTVSLTKRALLISNTIISQFLYN